MNSREFDLAIGRLENAFGMKIKREQTSAWFEKLRVWSPKKIELVVDRAMNECDRFPSLAMLKKIGESIPMEAVLAPRTSCLCCDSTGMVHAELREGAQQRRPYIFAFRCPHCKNWEGRESERVPLWDNRLKAKGYKLQSPHLDDITPEDLKAMRALAPRTFNKFLADNPAWLEEFQPVDLTVTLTNNEPSDFPIPPPNATAEDWAKPPSDTFIEKSQPPEEEAEWIPR